MTVTRSWDGQAVLESFMASMVEDDYGDVPVAAAGSRRRGIGVDSVAVGAVGVLIGVLFMAALFLTLENSDARQANRAALTDRIAQTSDAVAAQQAGVDAQRSEVEATQERLLAADNAQPATAGQIAGLSALTGTTALSGPGLSITLADAPDAVAGSLNRVLDRDLQDVVNAVWESGAHGVAVNGHRLTSSTAIRSAGDAILVNYEPISPPYVVTTVGASAAAAAGSPVQRLLGRLTKDYGLLTSLAQADVTLPEGELKQPRYAEPTQGSAG